LAELNHATSTGETAQYNPELAEEKKRIAAKYYM
jgi:hypothetical protein